MRALLSMAAVVCVLALVGGAGAQSPTLAGRKVLSLKAGVTLFRVHDLSAKENFHLIGPGVNKLTSKPGKAQATWRLRLKAGLYRYRSDASPLTLKGSFRVHA